MNDKKKAISALIFRIFGLAVAIAAITLQLFTNRITGKGFMANHVLAYFTIQTNIISALVFLYLIVKTIVIFYKEKELKIAHMLESVHLATVFYITITMTVYWLALAPMLGVGKDALNICNTLFLHLFTPLCAITDAVLFLRHGNVKKIDSVYWLAYPLAYELLVIIIANVSSEPYYKFKMGERVISLMYPYPFLDPQVVTIGGMIGIMILLLVLVLGLGYLYIIIDRALAKKIHNN